MESKKARHITAGLFLSSAQQKGGTMSRSPSPCLEVYIITPDEPGPYTLLARRSPHNNCPRARKQAS